MTKDEDIIKIEFPTIAELIEEAIQKANGRAELREIYPVIKEFKPKTTESAIRSVLHQGVKRGRFSKNPDGTYGISSRAGMIAFPIATVTRNGVILNGRLFVPHEFNSETEMEEAVKANYRQFLGQGTLYLPIKKLIGIRLKKVTDGLLLDLNSPIHPSFWIVEIELSTHDLESHVQSQMIGFLRALEDEKTVRTLVKAVHTFVWKHEDENVAWVERFFVPRWEGSKITDYEFIDNLLHAECGLMIVIDKVTPDLEAIVDFLSKAGRPVKVVEFKTFTKNGEYLHTFFHADTKKFS